MIDLLLTARDTLRTLALDGVTGRLKRIHSGIAVILPEITLGLYPDHIRLLRRVPGMGVETILPQLCARLGFVIPGADAGGIRDVLAGTEAYLARLERNAAAVSSEPPQSAPADDPGDPDNAGPSL